MNRYARIQDGLVAEVFETEHDITTLFHPALVWVRVPEGQSVEDGWAYENGSFSQRAIAPPAPAILSSSPLSGRINLKVTCHADPKLRRARLFGICREVLNPSSFY